MHILITGVSGYAGYHAALRLAAAGHHVTGPRAQSGRGAPHRAARARDRDRRGRRRRAGRLSRAARAQRRRHSHDARQEASARDGSCALCGTCGTARSSRRAPPLDLHHRLFDLRKDGCAHHGRIHGTESRARARVSPRAGTRSARAAAERMRAAAGLHVRQRRLQQPKHRLVRDGRNGRRRVSRRSGEGLVVDSHRRSRRSVSPRRRSRPARRR